MIVKTLHLVNIGKYRDQFWEFPEEGLIGVVGPNGAGKSTLIDAMYACLTNDFTRLNRTKEGVVCDLADEDEDAYVELLAEHAGIEFELVRRLPSGNSLKIDGEKPIRKAGQIKERLEEVLGLRRQLIDTYVFVEQTHMFGPFAQSEAERAEAFQYLCNTVRAKEIYEYAGKMEFELLDIAYLDLDDNRDQLRDGIKSRERKIKRQREKVSSWKASLLGTKVVDRYQQQIKNYQLIETYKKELASSNRAAASASNKLAAASKKANKAAAMLAEAAELNDLTAKEAEAAKELLQQYEQAAKADKKREQLEERLAAIEEPQKPKKPKVGRTLQLLSEDIGRLTTEYEQATETLRVFVEEGVVACPTCGTAIEELGEHLTESRKIVDSYPKMIQDKKSQQQTLVDYEKQLQNWEEVSYRTRVLREQLSYDIKAIKEESPGFPQGDPDEWQEAIEAYEQADETLERAHQFKADSQAELLKAQTELEQHNQAIQKWDDKIKKVMTTRSQRVKAEKALDDHRKAEVETSNLRASISALEEVVQEQQEELNRKNRLISRAAKARKFTERLKTIREVCHRNYWPRIVAENYLEDLQDDMNQSLTRFGSPFRVRALEGLRFEAKEPGCPWRHSDMLSWGQKTVLAVAFREAINLLFAAEIGMMALDEPTENLDRQNVTYLREALTQMAASNKSGSQIFIITHEDELRPAFDYTIEIEKES